MKLLNPLNLIPPQYKLAAYIVIAVLLVGILFGGGFKTGHAFATNHYTTIIAQMEADVATLRAEKAELQVKLNAEIENIKERVVTKYVDRVKTIVKKEYVYREQATNNVPDRTELSNGWVSLHDDAAAARDADSTRSSDGTGSGIASNQALAVVTDNYATCHANAEQLTALQEYVREVEKLVANANEILNKKKK
jgi:hypothetical protein